MEVGLLFHVLLISLPLMISLQKRCVNSSFNREKICTMIVEANLKESEICFIVLREELSREEKKLGF